MTEKARERICGGVKRMFSYLGRGKPWLVIYQIKEEAAGAFSPRSWADGEGRKAILLVALK